MHSVINAVLILSLLFTSLVPNLSLLKLNREDGRNIKLESQAQVNESSLFFQEQTPTETPEVTETQVTEVTPTDVTETASVTPEPSPTITTTATEPGNTEIPTSEPSPSVPETPTETPEVDLPTSEPTITVTETPIPATETPVVTATFEATPTPVVTEEPNDNNKSHMKRQKIGKHGGVFQGMDGQTVITFPDGALEEDADIWMGPVQANHRLFPDGLPRGFEVEAFGAQSKKEIKKFKKSIILQQAYNETQIRGSEENLSFFYYDETLLNWLPLPSWVDAEANIVYGLSSHLTVFNTNINDMEVAQLPSLDSAQTSTFTGAATYSYPIQLPPGPGGLQPSLNLSYNSQVVDNAAETTQASWAGMGWSIGTGGITRNMNGTNDYLEDDTFTLTIGDFSSMLVPGADGYFHTQQETFWRIKKNADDTWTVLDKEGNRFDFGTPYPSGTFTDLPYDMIGKYPNKDVSKATFVTYDFTDCSDMTKDTVTWGWPLTKTRNKFGKEILYTYYYDTKTYDPVDPDVNCHNTSSYLVLDYYPQAIIYPNQKYRVKFVLSPRNDYRTAWGHITSQTRYQKRILSEVRIEQDADGSTSNSYEQIIRKYVLTYQPDAANQIFPGILWEQGGKTVTLSSIQEIGLNGAALPATTFGYDKMHLNIVNNGYGGTAQFTYEAEPWHAENGGTSRAISSEAYGGYMQPCSSPNPPGSFWRAQNKTGASTTCKDGKLWIKVGAWWDSSPSYTPNYLRPGQTYMLKVKAKGTNIVLGFQNADGVTVSSTAPVSYSTPTDMHVFYTLPKDADDVIPVIECSECFLDYAVLQAVLTRYRVTARTLNETVTNKQYTFTYAYEDAKANTYYSEPCPCWNIINNKTCKCLCEIYSDFLGHRKVTETGPDGKITATEFYQTNSLAGKPKKVSVSNGYKDLTETEFTYYEEKIPLGALPHWKDASPFEDLEIFWTPIRSEESRIYNHDIGHTATRTQYNYDITYQGGVKQYGNVTHIIHSSWEGSKWSDYRLDVTRYYPNNDNANIYLVGLPGFTNQYKCPAEGTGEQCYTSGMAAPPISRLLSSHWYLYDNSTSFNVPPTYGKLTGNRTLVSIDDPINWTGWRYADVTYDYDAWGNRTRITTFTNPNLTANYATGPSQTSTLEFDSIYGTRLVKETNAKGHVTTYQYAGDSGLCGQPSSISDPNGAVTSYTYDAFCRLIRLRRPGDEAGRVTFSVSYDDFAANNGMPFKVYMEQKVEENLVHAVRRFYDGLGRLIQTQTANASLASGTKDVITDFAYDAYGNVREQTVPYDIPAFVSGQTYRGQQLGSKPKTINTYDALGRLMKTIRPDGVAEVTYTYNGVETSIVDANNKTTRQVADALGRVVKVHPPEGPWTEYHYDELNRLIQVDQYNATTSTVFATTKMAYDYAGNKRSMNDPDMGVWNYTYDALGNLTRQTDARGQRICLYYDPLNRLLGKHYRTDDSCPVNPTYPVQYTYDQGQYGLGRRSSMSDETGTTSWSYDKRGRVTQEIRSIPDVGSFLTQWGYNSADQVIWIKYPGGNHNEIGETVNYSYLPQETINTVTGAYPYVVETQYDAAGRVDLRKLGGDASSPSMTQDYSFYTWAETAVPYGSDAAVGQGGRLKTLKAGTSSSPTSLLNLSYTYRAVGNIATIKDSTQTQTFHYDTINRLIDAKAEGGSGPYPLEAYQYDEKGNLTQNGNGTLTYGSQSSGCPGGAITRQHAVVAAGPNTYCYDSNGNQVRRGTATNYQALTYNAENRLSEVIVSPLAVLKQSDAITLSVESSGGQANGYTYRVFDATSTYTIQSGDVLEFDVYLDSSNPQFIGGLDAVLSTSGAVRSSGWVDQNGLGIHTGVDLSNKAKGQWYHRVFPIDGKAGETLSTFKIAHEGNLAGSYVIRLDNIKITNNGTIKKVIYTDGFPSASSQAEGPTPDIVFQSTNRPNDTFLYDGDGNRVKSVVAGVTTYLINSSYEVERPDFLSLSVESSGGQANGFTYRVFDATTTYTIQSGDVLEFDVYLDSSNPQFVGGFDAMLSTSGAVRDTSGWVDQNGHSIHPGTTLPEAARGQWYHRVFPIGNKAGEKLSNFKIAHEGNLAGSYVIRLDNIKITTQNGTVTTIYTDGFPSASSQVEGPTPDIVFQSTNRATSYYSAGGQRIAQRRAGYANDNGLQFLFGDHLGSTSVVAKPNGELIGKQLYDPWGNSRYLRSGKPLTTPYQFTGQRAEPDLGIYYYGARWYDPYLNRFLSPDSIIPDPYNPLDWDRYSYVGNNPVNRIDPTGHTYCNIGACKKPKKDGSGGLTDVASRSSSMEGKGLDSHTGARVEKSQNVYNEVLRVSGKTHLTIEELLTMLSQMEFGILSGTDYDFSEEALGRQLYHWCGSDGLCQGDQLWQFLGSLHAWYGNDPSDLVSYIGNAIGIETSDRILNQEPSWKMGSQWDRPFAFGNLNMFPNARGAMIAGGQGRDVGQSWVLRTDLVPEYVVWTPEQKSYWIKVQKEIEEGN